MSTNYPSTVVPPHHLYKTTIPAAKPSGQYRLANGQNKMNLNMLLLTLLPLLAFATPITVRASAGGPIPKPIPSTCTITNPLPHSNCTNPTTTNNLKPSLNFTITHTLYAAYFDLPTPASELWTQCSEQCYGYGYEGECKSAVLAYDVPTPKGYHGGAGGELVIACLLFDESIGVGDWEAAVEREWNDVRAGSLYCRF
jgi:hypothetical protein